MAGPLWSYKIDGGIELNDITNFNTQVPQIDDVPDWDIKSVPIDGTYPAFIRVDPTSGIYTFLIQMSPCIESVFRSRLTTLAGIFTPAPHTFTFQARGLSAPKSVLIVPRGRIVEYKMHKLVINCHVPVPVPA